MDNINKICGVMDAQGFVKNDEFFPREICVLSNSVKQSQLCDTQLRFVDMNIKDRITNMYLANNLFGLSMRTSNGISHNSSHDATQVVYLMYNKIKTPTKPYLGVKNPQLIKILDFWGIPYVELEDYNCPNMSSLKRYFGGQACHFHERAVPDRCKLHCAQHKCELLWKWLIQYYQTH